MKMKFIAAASLLVCAGATQAQSNVTLYGVVDANVEYTTNLAGSGGASGNRASVDSGGLSGSRWGMRGVEDLGGGLSGIFVLESGFFADTGTSGQGGRLFGRQAFVGLQSKSLGQISLGRQYTALFELMANFAPMGYSNQYEPVPVMTGLNLRQDNMVVYKGTFGPVNVQAHWSFGTGVPSASPTGGGNGEVPGQFRRDSGYGAGMAYAAGPLGAALVYDQYNPSVAIGGGAFGSGTVRKAAVAASYVFGPAKLMGGYRWGQNKDALGAVALRDDYYWLGAVYNATNALALSLEYSYQKIKTVNSAPSTGSNPWQLALLADYNLSKRTDVYLTAAYARNAGLVLDQAGTDLNSGGYPLAAGKTGMLGAAVGIRQKF